MVEFEVGDVAGGTVADQEEREREEARRALIEGFRNTLTMRFIRP